jgi:hypothetical protein
MLMKHLVIDKFLNKMIEGVIHADRS